MALFSIVFIVVALVLIGVGIALGLVACALAAALIGLGVASSSVLVGLHSGRAEAGLRMLLIQLGLLAGIPAGVFCAWIARTAFEAYGHGWPVLIYGALGGAVAGLLIALLLDSVARRLRAWAFPTLDMPPTLEGS